MNEELGDAGAVVGDENDNGANDRSGTVNLHSKSSNDKEENKNKKKKKVKHDIDTEVWVGGTESDGKDVRYDGDSHGEPVVENSEKEEEEEQKKKKKGKKKKQLVVQEQYSVGDVEATRKEDGTKEDSSPPKSTSKRLSSAKDDETTSKDTELVRGKRFSPEEDKLVEAACWEYVNSKGLGDEGIKMILNCKKHKQVSKCWKEICAAIPWRPRESVRCRAHIIFERGETRKWTEEDCDLVLKYHEKHGAEWKTLADALGKHRHHVKDTFRRLKLKKRNSGHWSQDEYQALFDLVNTDLRMKAFEERKSKHGMLRDNISWTSISDKLETRNFAICCQKWYNQLASPMVAQGEWLDTDDYRLAMELYNLDACCMEDVDWDCVLEHRSGEVCRKRWNEMVKHLGDCKNKLFSEQVDILAKRYCSDVLEAREAYYSKPVVD
ncbi:Cyclin-D-binding Myb-like transcription factor 1 [Linum grandiflorum]